MKKILALTIIVALLVVTGISLADQPPVNSTLVMAVDIIQALKAQTSGSGSGSDYDAFIVMDGDYCVIYLWKLQSSINDQGTGSLAPRVKPILPQPMPDFKIIIGTVNVLR